MRPIAPMTRQWLGERNSFPVRGLVMYRWPNGSWGTNFELLRIRRDDIDKIDPGKAAYEVALSALAIALRHLLPEKNDFQVEPVRAANGKITEIPSVVLQAAERMAPKVEKLLEDGGGGIALKVMSKLLFLADHDEAASSSELKELRVLARSQLPRGKERKDQIEAHQQRAAKEALKSQANRRRQLAQYWYKKKGAGFFRRGLVYTSVNAEFWQFNIGMADEQNDPVPVATEDDQLLERLTQTISRDAVAAFASGSNYQLKDGRRGLRGQLEHVVVPEELPNEVLQAAAARLAIRLRAQMAKHRHGMIGLTVIERCLVIAWDPQDTKPLDEYPFPLAPTESPQDLDRAALEEIRKRRKFFAEKAGDAAAPAERGSLDRLAQNEDWVPLDEGYEDDDAMDRRAMELADHEQSAALRRLRGGDAGQQDPERSPIRHDIDYAGLPEDVD